MNFRKYFGIRPWHIMALIFVVTVLYMAYYQITYNALWYDESGQFWISAGLNHYSAPNSPWGGLHDIWVNNYSYNLDPGGFSLILRAWMSIATNECWLRMLPLTFLGIYFVFLYKTVMLLTHNRLVTLAVMLLNITQLPDKFPYKLLFVGITDLRAYPMEMCGGIIFVWMFLKWNISKLRTLVAMSLVLCFFCTSRYGFIVASFAFSLLVMYYLYKSENNLRSWALKYAAYGLPLLLCVIAIYFLSMQYQNGDAQRVYYLRYLSTQPGLLIKLISLELYFVIIVYLFTRKSMSVEMKKYFHCVIFLGLTFFLLSLLGLYPWDCQRTITMYLFVYNATCITILSYLCKYKYAPLLLCLLIGANSISYRRILIQGRDYQQARVQIEEISEIRRLYPDKKVFVDRYIHPDLRYACEYSTMKDSLKHVYGENLVLHKGVKHCIKKKSAFDENEVVDMYVLERFEESMEGCDLFVFSGVLFVAKDKGFKKFGNYNYIYVRE